MLDRGRRAGVPRASRRPGEDPRIPGRAGGDRPRAQRPGRRARGRRTGTPHQPWRGVPRGLRRTGRADRRGHHHRGRPPGVRRPAGPRPRLPAAGLPRTAVLGRARRAAARGHGKLERAALPDPEIVTGARPSAVRAAVERSGGERFGTTRPAAGTGAGTGLRTRLEGRLRALWAEEFDLTADAIGPETSFFDLGGHSIAAIRLVNRAREVFGQEYPMVRFYQEPTVRAMAAYLAGESTDAGEAAADGDTADSGEPGEPARAADTAAEVVGRAPATFQQRNFIEQHHRHALPQVFNVALRITLTGDLDIPALRTAL
ncbi:acyl carrier protein, partial [Streptomyces rimosus]|uniref:acyl carrier protein n=1 Tax=Streptomyces rimosus TaxID=1927 RepID=UPI0030CA4EE3